MRIEFGEAVAGADSSSMPWSATYLEDFFLRHLRWNVSVFEEYEQAARENDMGTWNERCDERTMIPEEGKCYDSSIRIGSVSGTIKRSISLD